MVSCGRNMSLTIYDLLLTIVLRSLRPSLLVGQAATLLIRLSLRRTRYAIRTTQYDQSSIAVSRRFFQISFCIKLVVWYNVYQTYVRCMTYVVCGVLNEECRIENGESGGLNRLHFFAFTHYLPLWFSASVANSLFEKTKPILQELK